MSLEYQDSTITSVEAQERDNAWCGKCKASKGHYTHEHNDWLKLFEDEKDEK